MVFDRIVMWQRSGMLTGQVWQTWSNHHLTSVTRWVNVMVPHGLVMGYHVAPLISLLL
jgi:hypothetical protein